MDPLLQLESQLLLPSPLQKIHVWSDSNIQYYIKRDDLIDKYISGNKYRKLKGYLQLFLNDPSQYSDGILTYGGAYSNHLYATASACQKLNIPMTALVRGLEVDESNSTLSHVMKCGALIHKVTRADYRKKNEGNKARELIKKQNYLIVPEGGNSDLAHIGVKDLSDEIYQEITPDYICIMSGTGATAEGILKRISGNQTKLIICSAVRDESVKLRILNQDNHNQVIWRDEIWGGFGKRKPDLIAKMEHIISETSIPLEYVYTGRLMVHLTALRQQNIFPPHSTVVIVHTGGLRESNH